MLGRHRHVWTWHGALAEVDEVGRGRAVAIVISIIQVRMMMKPITDFSGGGAGTCP